MRGRERSLDELRRATRRQEIRNQLISAGSGYDDFGVERSVRMQRRVDVREELEIAADDEQMEHALMNHLEPLHDGLGRGIANDETREIGRASCRERVEMWGG